MSKLSAVEAKAFLKKNSGATFFYTFSTQQDGTIPFCRGEVKADGDVSFEATPPVVEARQVLKKLRQQIAA